MTRRQLDAAIRCNPTNFTYKHEQDLITRNLMSHLIAAKPVVKTAANPYSVQFHPNGSRQETSQSPCRPSISNRSRQNSLNPNYIKRARFSSDLQTSTNSTSLQKSPKRISSQEMQRRLEVDRENKLLLQKMLGILGKGTP